jgi:hypothetical protein
VSRRGVVVAVLLLVVLAVGMGIVAATTDGGDGTGPVLTGAAAHPPGTASSTSPVRSLVVLPMGHLSDPSNTFWELFVRPTGATTWTLATPPGVADNGGLVVGASPSGPVTAAFLPSADLTFSVLARSVDGAATWAPGNVPGAVADAPDALATDPTGTVRAVLDRPSPTVVAAGPGTTTWTPVAALPGVDRTVGGCTVAGYTSVAAAPSGTVVVGARCIDSIRAGLLMSDGAGRWTSAGPLFDGSALGTTEVLRLQAGTTGMTALAEGTTSTGSSLVAAWGTAAPGSTFAASAHLAVPSGWSVLASAVGGGSGRSVTVLLGADGGGPLRVASIAGPGARWATLATPPAGTTAVAAVGSEVDAFVPSGSHLAVWTSSPGLSGWRRVARLGVPIQYGSSG